jgi:hypothetical protein
MRDGVDWIAHRKLQAPSIALLLALDMANASPPPNTSLFTACVNTGGLEAVAKNNDQLDLFMKFKMDCVPITARHVVLASTVNVCALSLVLVVQIVRFKLEVRVQQIAMEMEFVSGELVSVWVVTQELLVKWSPTVLAQINATCEANVWVVNAFV